MQTNNISKLFFLTVFIMAAEKIKHIGKFGLDGIQQAMERVLDDDEKKEFLKCITAVSEVLDKPAKTIKTSKLNKLPTSAEIFATKILPKIQEKLDQHDQDLHSGKISAWNIRRMEWFPTNLSNLEMDDLKLVHQTLIANEVTLKELELLFRFQRGTIYLLAYKTATEQPNFKMWFKQQFDISYDTALKLMTFSLLIRRYPRLLVCDLSYLQIIKHNRDLQNYLATENGELTSKLSQRIDITTAGGQWYIDPSEVYVPKTKAKTEDPDQVFYDGQAATSADSSTDDKHETSLHEWLLQNKSNMGKLLYSADTTQSMATDINQRVNALNVSQINGT